MAASSPLLLTFFFFFFFFSSPWCFSEAQTLSSSQAQAMFRIQRALEYPSATFGWNRYTNFCYLPKTANFSLTCSNNSVTHLAIVGDRPNIRGAPVRHLSENFSLDSLFTTIFHLSDIANLTLVSLGLWGELPTKVYRLKSLELLNLSSNSLYGEIPTQISRLERLETLDLSTNFLKGSVPDLTGLDLLRHIDLSVNRLGPDFPSLGENLAVVVLKNNTFKDNLPDGLEAMHDLQLFDSSHNSLFGSIPSFLFSLPSLQTLDLNGNSLSGALLASLSCGPSLTTVDISRNNLVGKLPTCLRKSTTKTTVMYSWNCLQDSSLQHTGSYCLQKPIKPLAVMPMTNDKKEEEGKDSKNVLGLLLGVIGAIVGAAILIVFILLILWNKVKKTRDPEPFVLPKSVADKKSIQNSPVLVSFAAVAANGNHMSPEVRFGMLDQNPYRVFQIEDLEDATDNFDRSNVLHEYSKFEVYKGRIEDGSAVTIRCLKLKQKHSPEVLIQHMESFSKLQHRHLVSIIGHCIADNKEGSTTVFLVFQHVSNGTLRSHLTEWRRREMLKWPQRMTAVIGVARGIQFLHTVTTPGIYGNDLKMENILLDHTLTAKIQNYNLPVFERKKSKVIEELSFNTTEEMGKKKKHGDKEDIYQLGLIILEVITGKSVAAEAEGELESLKALADGSEDDLRKLTDPAIHGTYAYESVKTVIEVALNCLSKEATRRPSIDDILWNMQYSVQIQDGCGSSEGFSFC